MKLLILTSLFISFALIGCKTSIKENSDKVYSRHLQKQMSLSIISTPLPNKKEEMNLLLFNDKSMLEETQALEVITTLFKEKKIQPVILVAYSGNKSDYGFEEIDLPSSKQFRKFNEFVADELYPFIKKKVSIRKFNSVAIVGFETSATSAFDIAFNYDEKIQMAGLIEPNFSVAKMNDSAALSYIKLSRKRPNIKVWIGANENDSSAIRAYNIFNEKKSIDVDDIHILSKTNSAKTKEAFAEFLMWAFPN